MAFINPASAQTSEFEPGSPVDIVDAATRERGDQSPVLVLGTSHLLSLPDDFDRARFDELLEKLAAWRPEAIAIEALSGSQCDFLREYAFAHPGTAETYCPNPTLAREVLGLTGAQASEEIENILAETVTERTPKTRRRLAALFLAAGEPYSALVQWLRLPPAEQRSDDTLTQPLVDDLVKRLHKQSENSIIAVPLAARLGHERLFSESDPKLSWVISSS